MIRRRTWTACLALAAAGCGAPEQTDTAATTPPVTSEGPAPADKPTYTFKPATDTDKAGIAAQKTCLVSDGDLTAMDPVAILAADGKTVGYLCCDGCEDGFKEDPAKFLAKAKKGE